MKSVGVAAEAGLKHCSPRLVVSLLTNGSSTI